MPFLHAFARPAERPDPRLTDEAIVRCLAPHLGSVARSERIEQVLRQRLASVTLVLEHPHDPHNGAAVLRSAEALGLLHVHVIQGDDVFGPKRKVTRGAHKWLNVHLHDDTASCLTRLRSAGFGLWAALPPLIASEPWRAETRAGVRSTVAVDVDRPVALVFGSEHVGLSAEAIALCAGRFHVPMFGFCESFNLSVSAALALSQVAAARRERLGRAGDLPPAVLARLRAAYYVRAVHHAPDLIWRWLGG